MKAQFQNSAPQQLLYLKIITEIKKIVLFTFIFAPFLLSAQNADSTWFVNNYVKKEVMISMRDGVKLFTAIYTPKDQSEKHPILLTRTPFPVRRMDKRLMRDIGRIL